MKEDISDLKQQYEDIKKKQSDLVTSIASDKAVLSKYIEDLKSHGVSSIEELDGVISKLTTEYENNVSELTRCIGEINAAI